MSKFASGSTIQEAIQASLAHHQNGRFLEALEGYEALLGQLSSSDPKSAAIKVSIHGNAGAIYIAQGEYDKARSHFDSSVQLQPENANARYNLAVLLSSKLNNHAAALKHCALAIKYSPSNHKAYHLMGNIMQNLGKDQEAERYFNLAETIAQENTGDSKPVSTSTPSFQIRSWISQLIGDFGINRSKSITVDERDYILNVLSLLPLVVEVENFVSAEDCDWICSQVEGKLEKSFTMGSQLTMPKEDSTDQNEVCQVEDPKLFRSSYNAWLPRNERLQDLQRRLSMLLGLPLSYLMQQSEDLQVVHYKPGGQFKVHQDSSNFHPRLLTALIYLNEPPIGSGETWFPYATEIDNRSKSKPDNLEDAVLQALNTYEEAVSCNSIDSLPGIKVTPQKGKAVIFLNHNLEGEIDPAAVHAGLPPRSQSLGSDQAEKWIANYWVQLDKRSW